MPPLQLDRRPSGAKHDDRLRLCAARRDEEHQAALYNILRNFGDVRTSADLIEVLTG